MPLIPQVITPPEPITITFTPKQVEVIQNALEVFQRMRCGQFRIAWEECFADKQLEICDLEWLEEHAVKTFFPELQGTGHYTYGITAKEVGKETHISYDIYKTLQQFLSLKKTNGIFGHTNDFDGTHKISKEPIPEICGHKELLFTTIDFPAEFQGMAHKLYCSSQWEKLWTLIAPWRKTLGFSAASTTIKFRDEGPKTVFYLELEKPSRILTDNNF